MLFTFLEQAIISWSAIEFAKAPLFVIFLGCFVIIKFIKVDDVSVVWVGSVITCFNPKMLSSDLKSLLSVLLYSLLKSPRIIISLFVFTTLVNCFSNTSLKLFIKYFHPLEVDSSNQLILILNFQNKFQSISFLSNFLSHICVWILFRVLKIFQNLHRYQHFYFVVKIHSRVKNTNYCYHKYHRL